MTNEEKKPRVGAMRVVREDFHNWVTEQYREITNKVKGEDGKLVADGTKRGEWVTIGYYGNLDQACKRALTDGAGGSGAAEIIAALEQSLKDLKAWSKLASAEVAE